MTPVRETDAIDVLARVAVGERAQLASLARREGLGSEDALDCVHDAFCTFLQMALRGDLPGDEAEYAPLLAGIVRNTARNKRRRHHLARAHFELDALLPTDDGAGVSAEALVSHAEECVRLRGCVNRLCKTQRTVVMMRLLEERPGEDVATAMGVTRGYVNVLLHRAKASLLVCMRESNEPGPP